MEDLQPCLEFLGLLNSFRTPPNSPPPPQLDQCFKKFCDRPVRIAIIDNGIDRFRSTINPNIEDGVSFVKISMDENKVLPWWSASDAHGTQMAFLIRTVNPYCRLLPARVGLTRDDIDPALAVQVCSTSVGFRLGQKRTHSTQAIKWAVKRKADIISISWTTKVESGDLIQAVKDAAAKNVLIFCSTADEGVHRMDKVWPADCSEVIKVSASDRLGHARPESQRDVDVLVDGDRLSAHGPSYMKNHAESPVSGSSVATALAAGLASLCLCMARLANDQQVAERYKDKDRMLELFEKMDSGKGSRERKKPLVPALLFKQGFAVDESDPQPPEALQRFKHSS
jgi:hypothetical protein